MTTPASTSPSAGQSAGAVERVATVAMTVVLHLITAPVLLFVLFLFAYGFREVTLAGHVVFLVGYVVIAAGAGAIIGLLASLTARVPVSQGVRYGIASGVALYALALAIGTLVSMANNDQNSVTADQPQPPFVVLVVIAFVVAVVSGVLALRILGRGARRAS